MFKKITFFLIIINILLASRWVIDGNIFFHTDIARDFLLMEDIVDNRHLTLIGPRSGAIPGVFHGPLWLYLNLPAFFLGHGNPVVVGYFWVGLYILSLVIIYFVGKRIFDEKIGFLSALLLSSATVLSVRSLFNPYGALLIVPLFFYSLIIYIRKNDIKILVLSLFLLGLIIQFQMAFGIPILILTGFFLLYYLFKNQKLNHLAAFLILFIPLSTFLLFDLRNQFLQSKSIINYFMGVENHGKQNLNFWQLLNIRFQDSVFGNLGEVTTHENILALFLLTFFVFSFCLLYKKHLLNLTYKLFLYYFLGFWLISFIFKGPIWSYYFSPFIPLIILIFCSFEKFVNKKLFYLLFFLIFIVDLSKNISEIASYKTDILNQDVATWKFNFQVAKDVFTESSDSFGYYIFTPDLYGYSPRYAMNYYQKISKGKKSYPFEKKSVTYLLISPPPEYGKDPSSLWYQKNINSSTWKRNDVRINKKSEKIMHYNNGFIIEKYILSAEEQKMKSNQYLIQSIFFR